MSKEKCEYANYKVSTRPSYPELGISKERLRELQNGCRVGIYSSEMLSKACAGFEFIKPWILLSVEKGRSYDRLEFDLQLGRVPIGRTDFYGVRRKFYHNLDRLLQAEQEDAFRERKE